MRLSACLIVKDEEQYLDDCLSSLSGFADEIIIVDTGSTDRSLDIARAHGARVVESAWREDFSFARNLGLDKATGDWILYIDADEQFDTHLADKSCLNNPHAIAATVSLQAAATLTPYDELRLFRNRTDLRFQSVIHETIRPAISAILERDHAATVTSTPYSLKHYGYEGDLTHKHERNKDMLLRATAKDPNRIYLWHALGECYMGLGYSDAAQQAWRRGLALVREGSSAPGDVLIYADLMSMQFNDETPVLVDMEPLHEEACEKHNEDPLIPWYSARGLLTTGEPDAALQKLNKLVALGPEGPTGAELGYDRRLFGEFSWALEGSCELARGCDSKAARCFNRALSANPDSVELRTKLHLANSRLAASELN